jgi:hypothetical protein
METTMTFHSFDDALNYGKKYAREYCRPCDKWVIEETADKLFKIAIKFKLSEDLVGYVQ